MHAITSGGLGWMRLEKSFWGEKKSSKASDLY